MKQNSNTLVGKKVKDYILQTQLGKGAFGQVYLASQNNEYFAVKIISKNFVGGKDEEVRQQLLSNEINFLDKCNNPNVVKMIKYLESDNNYYIVMEYCNQGDLSQRCEEKKIIPENEAIQYMKQILNGMRGLHENSILHRDLKLENIFISNDVLKIGDLGIAKQYKQVDEIDSHVVGTLGTMAPEVIESKPYGIQADMFSLGAIYYQLLFGQLPFSLKSQKDFLNDVKSNPPKFQRENVRISKESQNLLIKMLQYNPQKRLRFKELFDSPIFYDKPKSTMIQAQTVAGLMAKNIDIKQIKKIYQENEEQFEKITNQTIFEIKQGPSIEFKKIDEPKEDLIQLKIAQEHKEQETLQQDFISQFLELYVQQRNTITSLANIVQNILQREHPEITNAFVAIFMIVKRLKIEMTEFTTNIQQKKNIYDCPFFNELVNSEQFKNLVQQCQEDLELINQQFKQSQQYYQQSINQQNKQQLDVDDDIKQEQYEYPTQIFEEIYKRVLLQFFYELEEEKNQTNNKEKKMKQFNLMSDVLEAMLHIKKNYIWCQNEENDSELQYDDQCFERKEQLIEKKLEQAFV